MVTVFGIRHHGPGSARSLRQALDAMAPDCILVEGPPEADAMLPFAGRPEMKPPVALLIHDAETPQRAVYFPMAEFSPEWQAIRFGLERGVPARFMDLPQSIQMAIIADKETGDNAEEPLAGVPAEGDCAPEASPENGPIARDPLAYLARAAGYSDSERWWEHMVEHRRDETELFAAVLEAMAALREAAIPSQLEERDQAREERREAHMRQTIRAARKEGFERIAVVCGAWHAPALATQTSSAKQDTALLKGLPKRKVTATWIPWTYSRLTLAGGYGAGVASPGWYHFLWGLQRVDRSAVATRWLTKVARLLRGEDLDASSASVIEAARLAESLAALRGHPLPGLPELNDATQAALCFGDPLPLQLISERLIVSDRLGEIPGDTPMAPLAQDLAREQKRLRLPPEAVLRQMDLDLRKPNDLDRSRVLHRLLLLGIPWGEPERQRGAQRGTFHEWWRLQWQPEFAVSLIEAGVWGNTLLAAATARAEGRAAELTELPELTALLDAALLADLPEAVERIVARVQEVAAVASDVGHLMAALPALAGILRYGNVRQNDTMMVTTVVEGLIARIVIGLPGACGSLNDEAADEMFRRILECHGAISLLQDAAHTSAWNSALRRLADSPQLHGLIAGRACRLLEEAREFDAAETARRFGLALSGANAPAQSAAWIDGFLRESGLLLLHDDALWGVMDDWVTALSADQFIAVLPLLRRTFSTFQPAERRQMGARASGAAGRKPVAIQASGRFDEARANAALPLIARLLGLEMREPHGGGSEDER
ncbi:MAG TPA: DUF5682 family protein [Terriglobia bacterium]|nr:DUF5682 family protein [Terriglobia bacterium]